MNINSRHQYSPFFHINFSEHFFLWVNEHRFTRNSPWFLQFAPQKDLRKFATMGSKSTWKRLCLEPWQWRRPKARPVRCAVNRHMIYIYMYTYVIYMFLSVYSEIYFALSYLILYIYIDYIYVVVYIYTCTCRNVPI